MPQFRLFLTHNQYLKFIKMTKTEKAKRIVNQMMQKDAFSQWLGLQILEIQPGFCQLKMTVRNEMLNGFGIVHGGVTFSFADSALAFACNSQGRHAVSIETSISHLKPLQAGTVIFATAKEDNLGNKIAIYQVEVTNETKERIALFKGTVYRTSKEWEV